VCPRKVTIVDVARRAGVSIASVSRFLNNFPFLKEEKKRKIEQVIKELNYRPLIYARRLAGGRTNSIGLIIPGYEGIFNSFYGLEIIKGVGLALEKENIDLYLHIYWQKDNFSASLIDGVIFADVIDNREQLLRILKERVPCVVINRKMEDVRVSFVAIDNFQGAYSAVEFLIKHRNRKSAHIGGSMKVQCAKERLEGYKCALQRNNLEIREEYVKIANFSKLEAREKVKELLSLKSPPTAVFSASDDMAWEAMNCANELGVNIPKDLSIIGFDDNPICLQSNVRLTTVRQPLSRMACAGVGILRELIKKEKKFFKKIILPCELVVRDSVASI